MEIKFSKKFTSSNVEIIIKDYFANSLTISNSEIVTFDLQKIEWIALEQLCLLFGWFRELKSRSIKFKIFLPDLYKSNDRAVRRLVSLYNRWDIDSFVPMITPFGFRKIEEYFNITKDVDNRLKNEKKIAVKYQDDNWHKIIPFSEFDADYQITPQNLREIINSEIQYVFELEEQIRQLLDNETSFSPFKNKALSHIITTELYLNSVQHAYGHSTKQGKKCYLAVVLNNKRDIKKYAKNTELSEKEANEKIQSTLSRNFKTERCKEEQDFFYDDDTELFRNESFIEFSFIDFGDGIPSTLREKFFEEVEWEKIQEQLSEESKNLFCKYKKDNSTNIDSAILEFSFLLSTSKIPFEFNVEMQDYIPRGLFFLIDIVKRYSGMIVARSNKGKILYNFKNNSKRIKECVWLGKGDFSAFTGTQITIVLPAQKKRESDNLSAIKKEIVVTGNMQVKHFYIRTSEIFENLKRNYRNNFGTYNIVNYILKELNEKLSNITHTSSIIIIDLIGLDISVIDQKIYYYLCNTPYINERNAAILINIPDLAILINVQESIISNDVWVFRPIPCLVDFDDLGKSIWIGIKNLDEQVKLNELLRFKDSHYVLPVSDFTDIESLTGNCVVVNYIDKTHTIGNVSLAVPSISEIIANSIAYTKNVIIPREYILNLINNPALEIKKQFENTVFYTSSKYYQTEFISFIEKLLDTTNWHSDSIEYDDYFAKKISEFLMNKAIFDKGDLPKFSKIIAVTLSSHILAEAILDTYRERFIIDPKNSEIKLLKLTDYYNFEKEDAFEEIIENDTILIVNDVISTGSLNTKLYKSIKSKGAKVVTIFSIVDTRIREVSVEKEQNNSVKHFFDEEIDNKITVLANYPIDKIDGKTELNANIIRRKINPVINSDSYSPEVLASNFQAKQNLFFKDNANFLENIPEDMLLVGHLEHNNSHHPFFIDTNKLFKSNEGKKLLEIGLSELINADYDVVTKLPRYHTEKIQRRIRLLKEEITKTENNKYFSNSGLLKEIGKLENLIEKINSNLSQISIIENVLPIDLDFIIHPSDSALNSISRKEFAKYLGLNENRFQILRVPRVLMNQEWGIPFFASFFDKIFFDKKVLIIDDVSCTGETILKLIDSVCNLNVEKIIVFSLIVRLKDYQSEFLTRIQKIKVNPYSIRKEYGLHQDRVPIDVYFGSQLHMPNYLKNTSDCPHCKELAEYEKIKSLVPRPPDSVILFVNESIAQLQIYKPSQISGKYLPCYIPNEINIRKLYLVRDEIGKIEAQISSNKFDIDYSSYLLQSDKLTSDDLDCVLTIILHEPHLYNIFRNDDIFNSLRNEIEKYLDGNTIGHLSQSPIKQFYAKNWKKADLIFLFDIIFCNFNFDEFNGNDSITFFYCSKSILQKLIDFVDKESYSINTLAFILWKKIYHYIQEYKIESLKFNPDISKLEELKQVYLRTKSTILDTYNNVASLKNKEIKRVFGEIRDYIFQNPFPENNLFLLANSKISDFYCKNDAPFYHKEVERTLDILPNSIIDNNIERTETLWNNVKDSINEILGYLLSISSFLEELKNKEYFNNLINYENAFSIVNLVKDVNLAIFDGSIYNVEEKSLFIRRIGRISDKLIKNDSSCFSFFKSFETDLGSCWLETVIENSSIQLHSKTIPTEKIVKIHKSYLKSFFNELLTNIKEYGANGSAIYLFEVKGGMNSFIIENEIKSLKSNIEHSKQTLLRFQRALDKYFDITLIYSKNVTDFDFDEKWHFPIANNTFKIQIIY